MHRLTQRLGAIAAAPLLVLVLASCGGDDSITSADSQKSCESGGTSEAAKKLTQQQKTDYCKCVLPKLEDAGYKKADDFEKATKEEKGIAIIRECATKYLVRGY